VVISWHTLPGGIWPGQRTTQGMRMPPSIVVYPQPRSGLLLPWGGLRCGAPLGDVQTTSVVPFRPSFFKVLMISPVHQSSSSTESP